MSPRIDPVNTSTMIPTQSTVVIIGGRDHRFSRSTQPRRKDIPVVVIEKGN